MLKSTARTPLGRPTISSFLVPCLFLPRQQSRNASILGSLSDNPGAYNKRIRRGRGPASGKGKTSGRGHKGQKQHGKVPAGFNGGQTPDIVVSGERGFENQFSLEMSPINLDRIQSWIDQGRIDPTKPITFKELRRSRCLGRIRDGVKLLARNTEQFRSAINITVSRASASAIAAIEAAGGTVQTRYYTKKSIKRVLSGLSHPTMSLLTPRPTMPTAPAALELADGSAGETTESETAATPSPLQVFVEATKGFRFRLPDPASRKDIEYYRDPAHRGYLSYQLQPGQSPSLFFRTPGQVATGAKTRRTGQKSADKVEKNALW